MVSESGTRRGQRHDDAKNDESRRDMPSTETLESVWGKSPYAGASDNEESDTPFQ